MSIIKNKTYESYHFGLSLNLTNPQLEQLVKIFNTPSHIKHSTLGGRTSIAVTHLERIGSVVIKYYRRGGLIQHLIKQRYLKWGKPRCQIEYEILQSVGRLGVRVPEPIAYAYHGKIFYKAWLITREIKHCQTLAQISYANEELARIVMVEVIKQVSTLIENKLLHADLHPGNVIVDNKNQVYLLDFDKASTFLGEKNVLRNRYLRRWNRAIQKHRLPKMLSEINAFRTE
jgi:3-deoxy-D-manno-octulosonic acid kinase